MTSRTTTVDEAKIFAITRPHPYLLVQYFFWSLVALIFFPFAFIPLFFKYYTLRYRLDSEGISMSWGLLFRREVNLTYSRIQDIHLSRGLIERWLGLGSVAIQTASGSVAAEMVIQGLTAYAELRDFLYSRMRGHMRDIAASPRASDSPNPLTSATAGEALELLNQIHADLVALRQAVAQRTPSVEKREPDP